MALLPSVALLVTLSLPPSEVPPPAIPSGMDLLYGTRIWVRPHHQPVVPVGLMEGQRQVTFSSAGAIQVDYFEEGVLRSSSVTPGTSIQVDLKRAQPAQREYYVDLEGMKWEQKDQLPNALEKWRSRGFEPVRAMEEGMVFGLGGTVIDTRAFRVVLPAKTEAEAAQIASEVFHRYNRRAQSNSRIVERPWGELKVKIGGIPVGTATSYIRLVSLTPDLPITVHEVEFGRGYKWAGREDRQYHGDLYTVVDPNGTLAVVNAVGIEDILRGVVPAETFASAHTEALKAQAVAARSILFAQLGRRHHADPYHLCSSQHCQVYKGASHEHPRTNEAVLETGGEVLFHHQHLVNTTYSSTCGGYTEHNENVWDHHPSPSLRGKPDFAPSENTLAPYRDGINEINLSDWVRFLPETYCSGSSLSTPVTMRWERSIPIDELNTQLAKRFPKLGPLKKVSVTSRGVSGRATEILLKGQGESRTVLYELPIRRLFNNLPSAAFTVTEETGPDGQANLTFVGSGWGHGVGMCQLGAIGRAEAGFSYQKILSHYYSGAKPRRLYPPASPPGSH